MKSADYGPYSFRSLVIRAHRSFAVAAFVVTGVTAYAAGWLIAQGDSGMAGAYPLIGAALASWFAMLAALAFAAHAVHRVLYRKVSYRLRAMAACFDRGGNPALEIQDAEEKDELAELAWAARRFRERAGEERLADLVTRNETLRLSLDGSGNDAIAMLAKRMETEWMQGVKALHHQCRDIETVLSGLDGAADKDSGAVATIVDEVKALDSSMRERSEALSHDLFQVAKQLNGGLDGLKESGEAIKAALSEQTETLRREGKTEPGLEGEARTLIQNLGEELKTRFTDMMAAMGTVETAITAHTDKALQGQVTVLLGDMGKIHSDLAMWSRQLETALNDLDSGDETKGERVATLDADVEKVRHAVSEMSEAMRSAGDRFVDEVNRACESFVTGSGNMEQVHGDLSEMVKFLGIQKDRVVETCASLTGAADSLTRTAQETAQTSRAQAETGGEALSDLTEAVARIKALPQEITERLQLENGQEMDRAIASLKEEMSALASRFEGAASKLESEAESAAQRPEESAERLEEERSALAALLSDRVAEKIRDSLGELADAAARIRSLPGEVGDMVRQETREDLREAVAGLSDEVGKAAARLSEAADRLERQNEQPAASVPIDAERLRADLADTVTQRVGEQVRTLMSEAEPKSDSLADHTAVLQAAAFEAIREHFQEMAQTLRRETGGVGAMMQDIHARLDHLSARLPASDEARGALVLSLKPYFDHLEEMLDTPRELSALPAAVPNSFLPSTDGSGGAETALLDGQEAWSLEQAIGYVRSLASCIAHLENRVLQLARDGIEGAADPVSDPEQSAEIVSKTLLMLSKSVDRLNSIATALAIAGDSAAGASGNPVSGNDEDEGGVQAAS